MSFWYKTLNFKSDKVYKFWKKVNWTRYCTHHFFKYKALAKV